MTIDKPSSDEQLFREKSQARFRSGETLPADKLNLEQSRALAKLCRDGKLYEIEEWVGAGRSLQTAPELKKSTLSVALATEFHSLIEFVARNETNQETKNEGLAQAVRERQSEYVQLLLHHGAELESVPFIEVLQSWDPKMIRFFLDNGADAVAGDPFTLAFQVRIRTALRPLSNTSKAIQRSPTTCRNKLTERYDTLLTRAT